jgi:molybdate transport system substrate-binding protein
LLAHLLLVIPSGCKCGGPSSSVEPVELSVFAAASLREAFTLMSDDFEIKQPGVVVRINFAGTQELRTQIEHGAAADVLAAADQHHMDALARARLVEEPRVFARNELVLVVGREHAIRIPQLADLTHARRIVVGSPEVPIGRYTLQILERSAQQLGSEFKSQVEARIVSRELNVRQVLAKLSLGEADAGFVYRTDAATAGERVSVVEIPAELNVVAEYPIAVASEARHPELARSWVAYVLSEQGQLALKRSGFLPAEEHLQR